MNKNLKHNQAGIAHIGLVLFLVVIFAGAGFLVYLRFQSANDSGVPSISKNATPEEKLQKEVEGALVEVGQTDKDNNVAQE